MLHSTALSTGTMTGFVWPTIDPRGVISVTINEGATVAQIVDAAFPNIAPARLAIIRVTIGAWVIERKDWHRVRPKKGQIINVRPVPRGGNLRSVLSIAVTIAAIAVGQFYVGPALAGTGAFAGFSATSLGSIATAALGFAGNLLLNALIPIKPEDGNKSSPTYDVSGWKNVVNKGGVIPSVLGIHRVAPPQLAASVTETISGQRWVRTIVGVYRPSTISDIRIGDTPITDLDPKDYSLEIRQGYASDAPLTLYPTQISEVQVGVELEPHDDDLGDRPITRTSPPDATKLSIDFGFPGGLFKPDKDSGDLQSESIVVKIEQRLVGTADFVLVATKTIKDKKKKPFFVSHEWTPATPGRYEVRCTTLSSDPDGSTRTLMWVCLRAHRPRYPLNLPAPCALICAKVRATKLTNGTLDELNARFGSIVKDWDAASGTWIERESNNPASLYRRVLQGPEAAQPKSDAQVNLLLLQEWHAYNALKSLAYNRVHDYDASIDEVMGDVCRAGRATPQFDGVRYGVCIDRPQTGAKALLGPVNAWDFKWSAPCIDLPDAWRIRFRDQTYQYEEHERIVRRPGLVGEPVRIEELNAPGETDPAQVWRTGIRRFLELTYRIETWTCMQDLEALIAMRGTLVRVAPFETQVSAVVKAVYGRVVELDDTLPVESGGPYGARFRLADGASVLWRIATPTEDTAALRLTTIAEKWPVSDASGYRPTDDDWLPAQEDLAFVGLWGAETIECIVKDVEMGEGLTAQLTFVPSAPEIDNILDGLTPPAWDGRVGSEVTTSVGTPGIPMLFHIASGEAAREDSDAASSYPPIRFDIFSTGAEQVATYQVRHRLQGASTWSGPATFSGSESRGEITGYTKGQIVELQPQAVGLTGLTSGWGTIKTHTVGSADPFVPMPVSLTATTDGTTVTFGARAANTDGTAYLQFRRGTRTQTWDQATVLTFEGKDRIATLPADTRSGTDAPGTYGEWYYWVAAINDNGVFSVPAQSALITHSSAEMLATTWTTLGTGWSQASGTITKTAGTAATISQAVTFVTGAVYKLVYTVSTRTAGTVGSQLTGGTAVAGPARSAIGTYTDYLTAASGNNAFAFAGDNAFAGAISAYSLKRVG